MSPDNRSAAIAAAIILVAVAAVFMLLPRIVLWIGDFSPLLAIAVGALFVLSFFLIFWLRARYQRRHQG